MSHQPFTRAFPDLTRFFRWWFAELKALPPQRLKDALTPDRPSLLLDIGEERLTVNFRAGGKTEAVGHIDLGDTTLEQQRQELALLLGKVKRRKVEIALRLQPSQSLRWRLAFPAAAASDLPQAIAFQINQRTPFQAVETYSDHRIAERSSGGDQIWVEVALALQGQVHKLLAKAQAWNLAPDRVDVAEGDGDDGPSARGFNLLPHDRSRKDGSLTRRLNAALALMVAGLLTASVAMPLLQQHTRLERLEALLVDARREAATTRRLQGEIEALSREAGFLPSMKRSRSLQVLVIEELTEVLPDHTFLTELRIKGSDVNIVGSSTSASTLVGLLEGSPLFQRPRFRSSITQDPRNGLERFNLSFELEGNGAPDAER